MKQLWDTLAITSEGSSQVKRNKLIEPFEVLKHGLEVYDLQSQEVV